jgi:hypothetical protein
MQEFVFQLFRAGGMVWQRFQASAHVFSQGVLPLDSLSEARLVFFLALLMWYGVKIMTNLSWVYSALAGYALWRRIPPLSRAASWVLFSYLIVNLIITGVFLAEHLFLSKRYLVALSLVLMLWVPFAIDRLWTQWQARSISTWAIPTLALWILITSLGGIFEFGYSKAYMRQAGDWLAENVPANAVLYSNDYQIMYYSQHFGDEIFQKIKEYNDPKSVSNGRWKDFDYIALRLSQKEAGDNPLLREIPEIPVRIFENRRGDQVRIYKIED